MELIKLCRIFGSEPDLKMCVQNLRVPAPSSSATRRRKPAYFRAVLGYTTTSNLSANVFGTKGVIDKWNTDFETAKDSVSFHNFVDYLQRLLMNFR